jgi:hypothetical protein
MIYISQGSLQAVLPDVAGFRVSPRRMTAQKTAVGGNVMRQYSLLHESSAVAYYNNLIDSETAEVLEQMHGSASNSVILCWRNISYVAALDYDGEPAAAGQHQVSLTLSITRRVA